MDVFDRRRPNRVFDPLGVGGADRQATAQPTTGQCQAKSIGPMIATRREVDPGRAPKFPAAEYDRPIECTPAFQVAQERGKCRIEDLDLCRLKRMVADMSVPAIECHLYTSHTDLCEPAGGQAAAAKRCVAILGA